MCMCGSTRHPQLEGVSSFLGADMAARKRHQDASEIIGPLALSGFILSLVRRQVIAFDWCFLFCWYWYKRIAHVDSFCDPAAKCCLPSCITSRIRRPECRGAEAIQLLLGSWKSTHIWLCMRAIEGKPEELGLPQPPRNDNILMSDRHHTFGPHVAFQVLLENQGQVFQV